MHYPEFNPAFHTLLEFHCFWLSGVVCVRSFVCLFVFLATTDLNEKSNREILKVILQEFILSLGNTYN